MRLSSLFIGPTISRGRGVFTEKPILANTIIEIAPVIVMSQEERLLLDKTLLHDYIFEWGDHEDQCCMALGYVPIYNHACPSNCEYEMDYEDQKITIRTVKNIQAGEELSINYHGEVEDASPLWFTVK